MSELLPCPFCGCKSKIVQCDDEGNVRGEEYESNPWSGLGYRVVHESDDCPISTGEDGYNLIYDSREEAESHWNRRANECDRDELLKVADEIDRIADNASTDSVGAFLQVSTIRPASIKAVADRIRKALGGGVMEELKPCPFCGEEANLSKNSCGSWDIGCTNGKCAMCARSFGFDTKEAAIKAWNTRAERTCHFDQTDEIPTISGMIRVWECSNCGHECEELNGVYEYCPHCKAKVIQDANE